MLYDWTGGQARAIRAMLDRDYDGIDSSWEKEGGYQARPYISEWHNGRENGYVITLSCWEAHEHLVIVFYEHRNSDDICFLIWKDEHGFMNPPTLEDIPKGMYTHKGDVTRSFSYGQIGDATRYAHRVMEDFWKECKGKEPEE